MRKPMSIIVTAAVLAALPFGAGASSADATTRPLAGIPETGCYPVVPVSNSDMAYLHATLKKLNAMVRRAAAAGGAEFVNTYTPSLGHHVCTPPNERYVEGLGIVSVNGVAVAVPAHPNSAGAASQFRSTLAAVQRRR